MLYMPAIVVTVLISIAVSTVNASLTSPPPLLPTPSDRQMEWHQRGMYVFVHFSMNTFTNVEWGDGKEKPSQFNPEDIDTDQWCTLFREAGMTGVIITAKHHDGFCLWPSALTEHSIKNSPWKSGKGDLLKDLSESCKKFDLDFGIYLSSSDRHNPLYGTGAKYNEYFAQQLREVLSTYGEVCEIWFDGPYGEDLNDRRQEYDFDMIRDIVRELQPHACICSDAGPDIRWIGNEQGIAGETHWAMLRRDECYPGIAEQNEELNSGHQNGTHWVPGEAFVSIRPSWYDRPEDDNKVKSLEQLMDIWYSSIGRNANLVFNIPIARGGAVHRNDAFALRDLNQAITSVTSNDLALGRQATSVHKRGDTDQFAAKNVVDGNPHTYWATNDGVSNASIEIRLDGPSPINHVDLGEYIRLGQRIRSFSIQARTVDGWTPVAKGTTVGNRRIIQFRTVMANRVRIVIEDSRASPTLSYVRVYSAPPVVEISHDGKDFIGETEVYLVADRSSATIYYTLDGSLPGTNSIRHVGGPVTINASTTVRAVAFDGTRKGMYSEELSLTRHDPSSVISPARALDDPPANTGLLATSIRDRNGTIQNAEPQERFTSLPIENPGEAIVYQGYVRSQSDGMYVFHLPADVRVTLTVGDQTVEHAPGKVRECAIPMRAGWYPITVTWIDADPDSHCDIEWKTPKRPLRLLRGKDLGFDGQ